ncbi:hypothetical protein KPH14_006927 [Odynerus spinipes]|uniref:Uncharacterized protein n=1 Tax=Odynerus spinipes TaxID=1348599 RepID=A0AAD9RSI1_9HYME|nr:hypothetical protein KPH14_006927 [Odynerus spinipes]
MIREFLVDISRRAPLRRLLRVAVDTRHRYSTAICDTVASRYSQISTSKRQLSTNRSSIDTKSCKIPQQIFQSSEATPKKPLVTKLRLNDRPPMETKSVKDGIEEILDKWNVRKRKK